MQGTAAHPAKKPGAATAPSCLQGIGQGDKHISGSLKKRTWISAALCTCVLHRQQAKLSQQACKECRLHYSFDMSFCSQLNVSAAGYGKSLGMQSDAPSACIDVNACDLYHAHGPFHSVCWGERPPQHSGGCHLLPIAVCQDDLAHCSARSDDRIAALLYRLWGPIP